MPLQPSGTDLAVQLDSASTPAQPNGTDLPVQLDRATMPAQPVQSAMFTMAGRTRMAPQPDRTGKHLPVEKTEIPSPGDSAVAVQVPQQLDTAPPPEMPGQISGLDAVDRSIAEQDPLFATVFLFAQTSPPTDSSSPETETAGVQTTGLSSDRASIRVLVLPPLDQILPAIAAFIPSTGGPGAAAQAIGLIGLGGVGVWLRRRGTRRS
jgi:hypothetical protein